MIRGRKCRSAGVSSNAEMPDERFGEFANFLSRACGRIRANSLSSQKQVDVRRAKRNGAHAVTGTVESNADCCNPSFKTLLQFAKGGTQAFS